MENCPGGVFEAREEGTNNWDTRCILGPAPLASLSLPTHTHTHTHVPRIVPFINQERKKGHNYAAPTGQPRLACHLSPFVLQGLTNDERRHGRNIHRN